jgi:DNA repair exonuclease SbcCD nuclease subunit
MVAALRKLTQAFDAFEEAGCKHVFQVGDFFDTPTVARRVEAWVIALFRKYFQRGIQTYAIAGQHDFTGHSIATLANSPLAVISAACVELLENKETPICLDKFSEKNRVYAYGASFKQEIPKVESPESCNILVVHGMIGNRPLWPGQPLENPRVFLRGHPYFRIVLCGDYHYSFVDRMPDQLILNPGALMRKTLTDVGLGHKPSVCIVDTETLEVEIVELDCQPAEDIFDLTKREVKDKEALNRLAESLLESRKTNNTVAWKHIMFEVFQEKQISKEAQEYIDETIDELFSGR